MPPKVKKAYAPPNSLAAHRKAQEKKYGNRIVRKETLRPLRFIPSGVTGLDLALGGGWARGRYHQILGKPDTTKTAMVLTAMQNALETYPDEGVAYVDVERTITLERFRAYGLDPLGDERVLWLKPDSGEEVADMLRDSLRTALFSMAAIDSVGAIEGSTALYEKSAEESVMGKAAQLLTRMSKQIATIASDTDTAAFIVNQYRKDFQSGYDKAAGPTIMGYMTSDSVTLRRGGTTIEESTKIKSPEGDDIEVSHKVYGKVDRSKIRTPGATAQWWYNKIEYDGNPVGIDAVAETYDVGVKSGALQPGNGNYWIFPDGTKWNGKKQSIAYLRDNPKVVEMVRVKSLEAIASEMTPEMDVEFEREGE